MKKIIKNPIFTFILGALIFTGITSVAAYSILANDIRYTPKDSTWKKSNGEDITNVKDAIDELYSKANLNIKTENLKLIKGTNKIPTIVGKNYLIVFNITSLTSQAYTPALSSGYELLADTNVISASFNNYIYKTKAFIVKATAEQIIVSGSGDLNWNSIGYYEF